MLKFGFYVLGDSILILFSFIMTFLADHINKP